jgi:hypothetical protein
MTRRSSLAVAVATVGLLLNAGCIIIANGSWWGGWPTVWTETVTERMAINTDGLSALTARTHNGSITFHGQDPAEDAYVIVTRKAGAHTSQGAAEAFNALAVFVEPGASGTRNIGYRWTGVKKPSWQAGVTFEIFAPAAVSLDVRTHNGPVKVENSTAEVRVLTHNGGVNVTASGGPVFARTHNGGIVAAFTGTRLTLETHNGTVHADVRGGGPIDGSIETHNGGVELTFRDGSSTRLHARTQNGSIRCNIPITQAEVSRRRLIGIIGTGEGHLAVTTHNGSVQIKKASG